MRNSDEQATPNEIFWLGNLYMLITIGQLYNNSAHYLEKQWFSKNVILLYSVHVYLHDKRFSIHLNVFKARVTLLPRSETKKNVLFPTLQ